MAVYSSFCDACDYTPCTLLDEKNNFTVQSDSCCVQTPLARVFPKPLSGFQVLPSFNQKTKLLKCSVPALRKKWSAS